MLLNKFFIMSGIFLGSSALLAHVVDIHFPNGEEMEVDLKEYEMERRRSQGDTIEIYDDKGNKKEVVIATSKDGKDAPSFRIENSSRDSYSMPPPSYERDSNCYENATRDR